MKRILLSAFLVVSLFGFGLAQTPGENRVANEYTPSQISDMAHNAPYKYKGLVLLFEGSYWVNESGNLRLPNPNEVASIDIKAFDAQRQDNQRVNVVTPLGQNLVLMGRQEFIAALRPLLSPEENTQFDAFLARQESLRNSAQSKVSPQ